MGIRKFTAYLLCIVLFAGMFCVNIYAAGGILNVNYKHDGVTFDIYRVATRNADHDWAAIENFAPYKVDLNAGDRDAAIALSGYVERDNIKATASGKTENGVVSFSALENGLYLVVGETVKKGDTTYSPVPALVEVISETVSVDVKHDSDTSGGGGPDDDTVSCSAKKVWLGTEEHPGRVTVQLLKDGVVYDEVVLHEGNDWNYTWDELDEDASWKVVEKEVPDGYVMSVVQEGNSFTILNKAEDGEKPIVDKTKHTVRKVWDDGNDENRPERIKVHLLRDGEFYAEIELSAFNQWTYTWSQLDKNAEWSVVEADILDGYTVSYETNGNITTVINTSNEEVLGDDDEKDDRKDPEEVLGDEDEPVKLSVEKVWSGDMEMLEERPESVGVTLYDGTEIVETVWLGEWNNWRYSWEELDASGNWSVLESDIPKGYTPSYHVDGEVVTITNTATLIQTGQLKWPVPVLMCAGAFLVGYGVSVLRRKEEE